MAITRQAKNYKVVVKNQYQAIIGGKLSKYADKIEIDATDGNIVLASNKKVISNGGCES